MVKSLVHKAWTETRFRFCWGLLAILAIVSRTVLKAPAEMAQVAQLTPWIHMSFPHYLWVNLYDESLLAIWLSLAVILAVGGLGQESANGVSAFSLSLPVRRRDWLLARTAVVLLELVLLGFLPALLIPPLSGVVGFSYPLSQTLQFAVLLVGVGLVFTGLTVLVAHITGSEVTSMAASLCTMGAFFVLVKRVPALDRFDIFDTMTGVDMLDRHTYLLRGDLPIGTLAVTTAALIGMLIAAAIIIERRDL